MRPQTRRLLGGALGFAASWAGLWLLSLFAGDEPMAAASVRTVLLLIGLVVLGTAMLVSTAVLCSGLVPVKFRDKHSSA
jgi:hypothetical protein